MIRGRKDVYNYCVFSWQLGCGLFFWQLGCGVFVFGKLGCGGFFGARRNFLTSGNASKIFDAGVPRYCLGKDGHWFRTHVPGSQQRQNGVKIQWRSVWNTDFMMSGPNVRTLQRICFSSSGCCTNRTFESMIFLFRWWDMLVRWRVYLFLQNLVLIDPKIRWLIMMNLDLAVNSRQM